MQQIRKRIERLEQVMTVADYCSCSAHHHPVFVVEPGLSADELRALDNDIDAARNRNSCDQCGKAFEATPKTFVVKICR
jgi:hypothetical protein